jgi:hypothetical protein
VENAMQKTECCGLSDAELDHVVGGNWVTDTANQVNQIVNGTTPFPPTKPTLPCDSFDIICRILS